MTATFPSTDKPAVYAAWLVSLCAAVFTLFVASGAHAQALPTETEVANDQGNPLPIEGTVIVGNRQPIDVVDRPTAVGFVLSTRFSAASSSGLDIEAEYLAPDRVAFLSGVTLSAIRRDPTSVCELQVLYGDSSFLRAGQTDPTIATAVFGPPNGTIHVPTPPLLVGKNQALEVRGTAFNTKAKEARCDFRAELLFRRKPESPVLQ